MSIPTSAPPVAKKSQRKSIDSNALSPHLVARATQLAIEARRMVLGGTMSISKEGHDRQPLAAEHRHFYEPEEPEIPTPARRAALEALEREFRDLLAPAR